MLKYFPPPYISEVESLGLPSLFSDTVITVDGTDGTPAYEAAATYGSFKT